MILPLLVAYNFWADRMTILQTESGRVIELVGHVRLEARKADISADRGLYYEASRLSVLRGNALVKGKDYTISSDTLRYIPNPEYLYLSGRAFLEDKYRTISSEVVEVKGDSATATGHVEIFVKQKDVLIRGDTGYYDLKEKSGYLVGEPQAFIYRQDTIAITAETFYMNKDTLWATEGVVVRSGRATAWGDTLAAFERESVEVSDSATVEHTTLTGDCRVQWEGGWATSDSVVMVSVDGRVREMIFLANAHVHRREGGAVVEVAGREVRAVFDEAGEVSDVYAEDVVSGLYYEIKKEE